MSFLSKRWARTMTSVVVTLFAFAAFSVAALAQTETGQISGKVLDPNGAAVAGASVTAKNTETGAERTATADSEGGFTITNLQPGVYDVTATGTGSECGSSPRTMPLMASRISFSSLTGST